MRLLWFKLGGSSPLLASSDSPIIGSRTCCENLSVCPFGIPASLLEGSPVDMPTPFCMECQVTPKSTTLVVDNALKAQCANTFKPAGFPTV